MEDSSNEIAEDSTSTTIYLDPSGDLRLLVRDFDDEWRTLVVSSSAMCLASPVWRAMLNPNSHFKEAERQEVEFPDDDLDALLIVLRVAHLKFRELPESVSFDGLVNLAVISDKYDTVVCKLNRFLPEHVSAKFANDKGVVRKWLPGWLAPWYKESCSPGYEEWLSIAWTTGDSATFRTITKHLIESCNIDNAGRLCHLGKPFAVSIVPDIINRISEGRKYLITALLKCCSMLANRYRSGLPVCRLVSIISLAKNPKATEWGQECDTIVYGSLIRGLETIGIMPSTITSSDIRTSVSELMHRLQLIHCYSLRDPQSYYLETDHSKCAFTKKLNQDIDHITKNVVPLAVYLAIDDSFQKHMKEQAEK